MKLTPRNRETREQLFTAFVDEFFGIRGLPKIYQAEDVYFFYKKYVLRRLVQYYKTPETCPVILSRLVFLKKLRSCETVDYRTESRRGYFFSVGNDESPVFAMERKKLEPVVIDETVKEFYETLKGFNIPKYISRSDTYKLYKKYRYLTIQHLGRNAFYAEMRKIVPEGHGKTRYFCIKKTKINEN